LHRSPLVVESGKNNFFSLEKGGPAIGFVTLHISFFYCNSSRVKGKSNFCKLVIDDSQILLPSSIREVLEFRDSVPNEVELVELHTQSIGYAQSKEAPTLFVIPGLRNRQELLERFRKSLYPVFIVNLPTILTQPAPSMEDYASAIVPVNIKVPA